MAYAQFFKKYRVHAEEIRSSCHAFKDIPTIILADDTPCPKILADVKEILGDLNLKTFR